MQTLRGEQRKRQPGRVQGRSCVRKQSRGQPPEQQATRPRAGSSRSRRHGDSHSGNIQAAANWASVNRSERRVAVLATAVAVGRAQVVRERLREQERLRAEAVAGARAVAGAGAVAVAGAVAAAGAVAVAGAVAAAGAVAVAGVVAGVGAVVVAGAGAGAGAVMVGVAVAGWLVGHVPEHGCMWSGGGGRLVGRSVGRMPQHRYGYGWASRQRARRERKQLGERARCVEREPGLAVR